MPGPMQLCGAVWSFVGATLRESVAIYRSIGIRAVDLIALPGATLDSGTLIRQPAKEAKRINDLNVRVGNLIFCFASDFSERAINHRDSKVRTSNVKEFHAVIEFCRRCSIPSVTVLPGIVPKAWSRQKALAVSGEMLNELARIANERGIVLAFEAHVGSVMESPKETLAFLQANPSLKLTLDYSHFLFNGYSQQEVNPLIPYAAHVHLRQGAKQVLQARWEKGVIDFGDILRRLRRIHYQGYLALEYEHDSWLHMDQVDVMTETIKMRNLVRQVWASSQTRMTTHDSRDSAHNGPHDGKIGSTLV